VTAPIVPVSALSATDRWFGECFVILTRHLKRPATIVELAAYVNRSASTTHRALARLALAGLVERGKRGRYEPRAGK
jgi:predicted transcriptional regulator